MRVLVIPDLHAPYQHPRTLEFLRDVRHRFRTDATVCIGDLGDQHAWSRFGAHADASGATDEEEDCRSFLNSLYKRYPNVLACIGNHDERLPEAMVRQKIPARFRPSIPEIYDCPPGWVWDYQHEIDGVLYTHGVGFSGENSAIRAAQRNMVSTVIGHVHGAAGVRLWTCRTGRYFGMNVGCLIDPLSPVFRYARDHATRPCLGCGVVIDGVPTYIPMPDSELDGMTQPEQLRHHERRFTRCVESAETHKTNIELLNERLANMKGTMS